MANSVDPDQTAPIGAVCSGCMLFASKLNSSVMIGNYLQQTTSADDFSRRHFQMNFFLAVMRGERSGSVASIETLGIEGLLARDSHCVVSLSKKLHPQSKVDSPRKTGKRTDTTEKLLAGT